MMKNKIMTVLLLTAAGFGQDAQAMAGAARKFAKEVFYSKEAKVAVLLEGLLLSSAYLNAKQEVKELQNGSTSLSQGSQEKIQNIFASYGYFKVKIRDGGHNDSLAVAKIGDEVYCLIGDLERVALDSDKWRAFCYLLRGQWPLDEKEVEVALKHEICHLNYSDGLTRPIVSVVTAPPIVLVCAKAIGVAGASRKVVVAGYAGISCGLLYFNKKLAQYQETRADRFAASTAEEAELLVSYFKKSGLSEERAVRKDLEGECISIAKEAAQGLMILLNRFTHDHPLPSDRIAYLEAIAAEFRKKKTLAFKVGAFAKQQRAELGKLFRGELPAPVKKIQSDPIKVISIFGGVSGVTKK